MIEQMLSIARELGYDSGSYVFHNIDELPQIHRYGFEKESKALFIRVDPSKIFHAYEYDMVSQKETLVKCWSLKC